MKAPLALALASALADEEAAGDTVAGDDSNGQVHIPPVEEDEDFFDGSSNESAGGGKENVALAPNLADGKAVVKIVARDDSNVQVYFSSIEEDEDFLMATEMKATVVLAKIDWLW